MNHFNLNAKISTRRENHIVYLKESDHIVDFMNIIGAHSQLLEYENVRIIKGLRNTANRIVNCESANLDKSVNAAGRHMENIRLIDEKIGIRNLPDKLRIIAEMRMQNPYVTLKELAEMTDPPVSKSGVNHRLARIGELADRLREESEKNGDAEKIR